jgi:hypothetical protein
MPVKMGCSSPRSDVKHWAKCGARSLRYCREWCSERDDCGYIHNKRVE